MNLSNKVGSVFKIGVRRQLTQTRPPARSSSSIKSTVKPAPSLVTPKSTTAPQNNNRPPINVINRIYIINPEHQANMPSIKFGKLTDPNACYDATGNLVEPTYVNKIKNSDGSYSKQLFFAKCYNLSTSVGKKVNKKTF